VHAENMRWKTGMGQVRVSLQKHKHKAQHIVIVGSLSGTCPSIVILPQYSP